MSMILDILVTALTLLLFAQSKFHSLGLKINVFGHLFCTKTAHLRPNNNTLTTFKTSSPDCNKIAQFGNTARIKVSVEKREFCWFKLSKVDLEFLKQLLALYLLCGASSNSHNKGLKPLQMWLRSKTFITEGPTLKRFNKKAKVGITLCKASFSFASTVEV